MWHEDKIGWGLEWKYKFKEKNKSFKTYKLKKSLFIHLFKWTMVGISSQWSVVPQVPLEEARTVLF